MENELFQTSLYFFSSLLQADAAILGLGTIFIIFKLQSLDTLKQNIIQAYYIKGPGHIGNINGLLFSKTVDEIVTYLKKASGYDLENYKHIICIPKRAEQIGSKIKLPIWIIGSHTIYCAILLLVSHKIYNIPNLQWILLGICLVWFAIGIFLAGHLAINILTKKEDFKLDKLLPDVCNKFNSQ